MELDTWYSGFNFGWFVICSLYIVGFPPFSYFTIKKHENTMEKEETKYKYGALWMGLILNSPFNRRFNVVLYLRKFFFSAFIVYVHDSTYI